MYAMSTQYFTPIKQNKFLERKRNLFTTRDEQLCECNKQKKLSKMEAGVKSKDDYKTYNCGE